MQTGSVLLQVESAWQVRVVVEDNVYPMLQLNVATDS